MSTSQQLQDPLQQQSLSQAKQPALEDSLSDSLGEALGDPLSGGMGSPLQLATAGSGGGGGDPTGHHDTAMGGLSGSGGTLPHLDTIQSSFGHHDVTGVSAHTDGAAQRASLDLNARGFALGDSVALGKSDLFTTAHEAAHTVQQQSGLSLKGNMGQAGDAHEQHADAVASKVVNGESAEGLLDTYTAGAPSVVGGGGGGVQMLQRDVLSDQEDGQKAMVEDVAQDLGAVDSVRGMQGVVGGLLDMLAPGAGDKKKLSLKMEVACSPVVSLGLAYGVEIGRTKDGKLTVKTTVDFRATAKADLWVAEAIIEAKVGGYIEAQGSNGAQIMDLVGLAIHEAIAAVSTNAAAYVFGETFSDDIREGMDDDDYIESGITAGVSGGLGVSGDVGDASLSASAAAEAKGKLGVRHTKSGSEVVADASAAASARVSASISGTLPGTDWKGTAKLSAEASTDKAPWGQIELALGRDADMEKFVGVLKGGGFDEQVQLWVAGAASMATGLIGEHAGMDIGGHRSLGAMVQDLGTQSISAGVGGSGMLDSIHDKLGSSAGAEMKQALEIKLRWSAGKATLDVGLNRASKLKVSANIKAAKIEVMIENVMRVLQIPTVTF